ncbi:MAG TPA: Hsp70 family protein [Glycomyces sp.]|nr:Hsp70 family protein [Glycomyces sp.]
MQTTLPTIAVGVDIGSSTTSVSTRHGQGPIETRHFDADLTTDTTPTALLGDRSQVPALENPAFTDLAFEGPTPVGLAVPSSWDPERSRAHAEAASRAGFEWTHLVPEPEAAARHLAETQGRELDPDARLVVCNIGAGSCRVAVVHREDDRYVVDAAAHTDDLGGDEFDRLLLSYLSGRHRSDDPTFWDRTENPADTALRTRLLDEIRRAREHLTEHPAAAIGLPADWPELFLTRIEVDRCIAPAIAQMAALVEDVLCEAGIGTGWVTDVLLIGGASRTPLAATMLRERLGVEPIVPEMPEGVLAEGAAFAALAHAQRHEAAAAEEPGRPARLRPSRGVLTAVGAGFAVLIAVATVALVYSVGPDTDEESIPGAVASGPSLPGMTDAPEGRNPDAAEAGQGGTEESDSPTPSATPSEGISTPSAPSAPSASTTATTATSSPGAAPTVPAPTTEAAQEETASTTTTVPNVIGLSAAKARRKLAEAGFTDVVAKGERRIDADQDHCETIAQTPNGGTRHAYDERITLNYVYVGNDDC